MAYRVVAAKEFEAQLDEAIAHRIDNYGLRSARKLMDDFDAACVVISENPLLGRSVRDEEASRGDSLRWMRMGSYIAVYRPHDDRQEIALLKMFAASSNWRRRVNGS